MAFNSKKIIKVKRAMLYKESNSYYIDVTYSVETDYKVEELRIPKIYIPLERLIRIDIDQYNGVLTCGDECELPIVMDDSKQLFTTKLVKEDPEKLTIEEIEKRIGHSIEIVSKDKKAQEEGEQND